MEFRLGISYFDIMELPIQMISTDFDGTFFAEFESPPVPVKLQKLIGDLQARGAKWVINTGRDMSSLMETLGRAHLPIHPDYLVLVEREIYVHRQSQYVSLEEWNSACAREHALLFERIRPDLPRIVRWIQERFSATLYEDAYSPFCLIADNNADADLIHAYLEEYSQTVEHLSVVRNDVYARFSHRSFNKGTALAELARRAGIQRERVFAIGDHLNDLPMLLRAHAGFIAAPQNAVPTVKAAVLNQEGYISPHAQGWGVADALERFLGGTGGLVPDEKSGAGGET